MQDQQRVKGGNAVLIDTAKTGEGQPRRHPMKILGVGASCVALVIAGMTVLTPSAGATRGAIVFPVFLPFSGPTAVDGTIGYAGCPPAIKGINSAGGIDGYKARCEAVDTRGDPADAVSAARKLLAATSNIGAVIGPTTGVETATVPVFETAHVLVMDEGGSELYDHQHSAYYWRTTPPDIDNGVALAMYAKHLGIKHAVAVFANDPVSQGNVPGLIKAAKVLGIKVTLNLALAPDQTSYETVVGRIIAAKPQAIFTETDPQTAEVLFSELKAAGYVLPTIGTAGIVGSTYNIAVIHAVGRVDFKKYWTIVQPYGEVHGPAFSIWNHLLRNSGVKSPSQYADTYYAEFPYDDINAAALAMVAAHSIKPTVYSKYMVQVTEARPGAVVVHSFAAGKKDLLAGKKIQYVGVTGAIAFNKYDNSPGSFAAELPGRNYRIKAIISPEAINKVALKGHV